MPFPDTTKWTSLIVLLCITGFVFTTVTHAQTPENWDEVGRLPLRYIDPSEYNAHAENWDATQDDNGILYFANSDGVLIYDGVSWELVRLPNRLIVRAVVAVPGDKVYVGGNGELGYLDVDSSGATSLVSLLHHIPESHRDFLDVWHVVTFEGGVYFSSDKYLFRWKDNAMKAWDTDTIFGHLFTANNNLFIREKGKLLHLSPDDSLKEIIFADSSFRYVRHFMEDGPDHLLGYSRDGFIRCYIDLNSTASSCVPKETELDPYMKMWRSYSFHRLKNGNIAVGFDGKGVALLGSDGSLLRLIGEEAGLQNLEVMDLFTDREGALWLPLYDGIARMEPDGLWSDFSRPEGIPSKVMDVVRWRGELIVATMLGLYQMVPGDAEQPIQFKELQNSEDFYNCFEFQVVASELLSTCTTGIARFNLSPGQIASTEMAYEGFFQDIERDPASPSMFYAAGEGGVYKFQLQNNSVKLIHKEPIARMAFNMAIEPRKPGQSSTRLWTLATPDHLYRLDIPDNGEPVNTLRIDSNYGLSPPPTSISILNDTLRVATEEGLYSIIEDTPRFQLSESIRDQRIYFVEDARKKEPLVRVDDSYNVLSGQDLQVHPSPFPSRIQSLREINSFFYDQDSTLWIAHGRGLARIAHREANIEHQAPGLLIKRISTTMGDSVLYNGFDEERLTFTIPHQEASLRFEFASQVYDFPDRVQYREWMQGLNSTWGKWTSETAKEYSRLREGTYTFHIQARNLDGVESQPVSFTFTVLPPWYRTAWAYTLWLLSGGLLFFCAVKVVNRYQTRRLQAHNEKLNRLVAEQTEEIKAKNLSLSIAYEEAQVINDSLVTTNRILENSTDQLRETLEANKEILGITAHDLKNPLGGIIGLAEMVIHDFENGTQATYESAVDNLPMLKNEAERMLKIIKDLLDKHREGEKSSLNKENVLLGDIVSAVIRWNKKQANNKEIQLHYCADENNIVHADIMSMQRVLDNYVSNAIKYSPSNSNVWIQVQRHENSARVTVRDEGPGLTEKDKQNVFGKMQRLSAKPTAGEHSTGLGLYIVQKLVKAHGGEVGVDSVHGEGATFWFTLPLVELEIETNETQVSLDDTLSVYN